MAKIITEKCTGCKNCLIFCPDDAINYENGKCSVDPATCTECYVCLRHPICPADAFEATELDTYLKQFQHVISDPSASSAIKKGVAGRGAQEVKTVDVTNRIKKGEIDITIDMGRPGMAVYLRDVEKVAMAICRAGVQIPPGEKSPLASIMPDRTTGKLIPECLDYRLHSLIMEGTFPDTELATVVKALQEVEKDIDTVFTVGLVMHVDANCHNKALDALDTIGYPRPHRGKINVGFGRPYPPKLQEA